MKHLFILGAAACACGAQAIGITGQWEFNGNLSASIGTNLTSTGTVTFESATIAGQSAQVAHFANGAYFTVPTGAGANGGGSFTNQYSIIMDMKFNSLPAFACLYQTNENNSNDGDWFVRNDGGMGISGDYTDAGNNLRFTAGDWHRVALTIDTTTAAGSDATVYKSYVDGQLVNTVQSPSGWGVDGRFSLDPTFLLFADNDGETAEGSINSLQFRDYAMSSHDIAALGGATAGGVPVPEPSTLMVLCLGLLAARRRNRS